jgi:hypothetical protein
MFCDQCGSSIQSDHRFCAKCGKTIHGAADPYHEARFARHLHLLGIFWIVAGALWLIPSFALMTAGHFGGLAMWPMGPFHHVMFPPMMFGFGGGLLLIAAAGICIGWGLMQREPWARTAAIILGILALFHPPFGTALGVYTLWVLLSIHAGAAYDQVAGPR